MQPGTPHYVITLAPSIVLGQHLYAASTIRQSCWAILHTTILNKSLTNVDHPRTEQLLQRMLETFVLDFDVRTSTSKFISGLPS